MSLDTSPAGDRRERGQALIELAFVMPILLVLILVIIDFGIALDRRETLVHAVGEAGTAAIRGATPAAVNSLAVAQSDGLLQPADVTVCYLDGSDAGVYPGDTDDAVRITIDYQYEVVVAQELLSVAGVTPLAFDINPKGEALLLADVVGATQCA